MARFRTIAAFFLLVLLIVAERLHTYEEPPHPDLDSYAVMGHELLAGRELYSDLWENRPPAVYVTFAVAEAAVGRGSVQLFALAVAAGVITLFGVYAAGARAGIAGGLLAGLFWAVVCGDLRLEANQPNAEVFINAARALAFAAWLGTGRRGTPGTRAWITGALIGAASLYKQFVLVDAVLLSLAHVAFPGEQVGASRNSFRDVAVLWGVCGAIWAALLLYFGISGRLEPFMDAVIRDSRFYASENAAGGGLIDNMMAGLAANRLLPGRMRFAASLAVLSLLGVVLGMRRDPRAAALLLAWLAATELDVVLPGRFYIHYYQLWLPPLAVGAAWGIVSIARVSGRIGRALSWGLACATLVMLLRRELYAYVLPAREWAERKYPGRIIDFDRPAKDIESLLEPGETFYEFGNEVGLYRATGRHPPTGVLYVTHHLTSGPLAPRLCARVIGDLERERPELWVMSSWLLEHGDLRHPVLRWGLEHYRQLRPADGGVFVLLVRRGGRLDQSFASRR